MSCTSTRTQQNVHLSGHMEGVHGLKEHQLTHYYLPVITVIIIHRHYITNSLSNNNTYRLKLQLHIYILIWLNVITIEEGYLHVFCASLAPNMSVFAADGNTLT